MLSFYKGPCEYPNHREGKFGLGFHWWGVRASEMREKESERGREGQHSSASDSIYNKRRYWAQVVKLEGPCEGGRDSDAGTG